MLHDPAALTHEHVLTALAEGAADLVATVRAVTDWDAPELGSWTVRELTAHTLRAFTTIETALAAAPVVDEVVPDAASYYRRALADPSIHDQVAARGRAAGRQLDRPVDEAQETCARVVEALRATDPDRLVATIVGRMPLTAYLATRVVELGVHTTDLQVAAGQPARLRDDVAMVVLAVLTSLAEPTYLVRLLTGREQGNVLG